VECCIRKLALGLFCHTLSSTAKTPLTDIYHCLNIKLKHICLSIYLPISSVSNIVAASVCAKLDEELEEMKEDVHRTYSQIYRFEEELSSLENNEILKNAATKYSHELQQGIVQEQEVDFVNSDSSMQLPIKPIEGEEKENIEKENFLISVTEEEEAKTVTPLPKYYEKTGFPNVRTLGVFIPADEALPGVR
tara:strand:+ start:185 stop:760 length:576 start_codon:yes stop_codon:yes gene_type:complete